MMTRAKFDYPAEMFHEHIGTASINCGFSFEKIAALACLALLPAAVLSIIASNACSPRLMTPLLRSRTARKTEAERRFSEACPRPKSGHSLRLSEGRFCPHNGLLELIWGAALPQARYESLFHQAAICKNCSFLALKSISSRHKANSYSA